MGRITGLKLGVEQVSHSASIGDWLDLRKNAWVEILLELGILHGERHNLHHDVAWLAQDGLRPQLVTYGSVWNIDH